MCVRAVVVLVEGAGPAVQARSCPQLPFISQYICLRFFPFYYFDESKYISITEKKYIRESRRSPAAAWGEIFTRKNRFRSKLGFFCYVNSSQKWTFPANDRNVVVVVHGPGQS